MKKLIGTHDKWFIDQYNIGRITFTNENRVKRVKTGKLIDRISRCGYFVSFLNDLKTRKLKTIPTHRLIWMIKNNQYIPDGMVINHIDGCKINNDAANLEISTHSQNNKHAHFLQLNSSRGEKNSRALYSNETVKDLRKEFATTEITYKDLINRECVGRVVMWRILKCISYRYVVTEYDELCKSKLIG